MNEILYKSADGKSTIHACVWKPQGEVRAILQIIHGMAEYAARYAPIAEFLNEKGILVCAEDHLGHGLTAKCEEDLGYFADGGDYKTVLADIRALSTKIRSEYKGVPFIVMGHSMGSFFCRNYIAKVGSSLDGAIIMGTGFKGNATLNSALNFVKLNAKFHGWRNRSKFIKKLAFGSYNKRFKPARTENDWLSANPVNVDAYCADKLCGFPFTNNGYKVLFSVIKDACALKTVQAVPKSLPVIFLAGEDDPVGDYGKGVMQAYRTFVDAGIKKTEVKLYKGCRHEILNDYCKQEVYDDILSFINGVI